MLDPWSRRIVGWAFSADLKARVVLDALVMALAARKPRNVIHRSDQGSQGRFKRSSQHSGVGGCDALSVWMEPENARIALLLARLNRRSGGDVSSEQVRRTLCASSPATSPF
ncbi:hypothetical protein [Enterovirga rhinocerotis]|uniref:hypothetical protein n=1 Tax=Enterovirga rhinocerotis TaxID=1339210 RepID=UPI003CCA9765